MSWIRAFVDQPEPRRRQLHLLVLAMAVFLVHATLLSTWQIEDAAITHAFARNAAAGEGFVANPGGTWVQGFSNPSWTLFLTLTSFLGLPVFAVAKVAGVGSGLLTLPLAWLWARRLTDSPDEHLWPTLTPLLLAFYGPYAIWSASGLENGFFNLFLTSGVVLLLREGDARSLPWSAVPLALLALTRPEAPVYVATIALLLGPRAVRAGGIRWSVGFVLGVALPVAAWYAWAHWAFGWALPNTYYAKDPSKRAHLFKWKHRTWSYLRQWSLSSTLVFATPLFVWAQSGLTGVRKRVADFVLLVGLIVTVPGVAWLTKLVPLLQEPRWFVKVRIAVYVVGALTVIATGWGRPRDLPRRTAALLVLCTMAFSVLSGGDWMRGFRWFSLNSVPLAVLAAEAFGRFGLHMQGWARLPSFLRDPLRTTALLAAPMAIAGVGFTVDTLFHIDTSPFNVRRRALYHQGIADRLHLDHVSHMEIDMGGNLFWSGFELYDIAGLVDVPIGHHHYDTAFIDQYVGREIRPAFVHIHGGWEAKSKVVKRPWFRSGWTAVPGYAHTPRVWHRGTYVRRDLFVDRSWPDDEPRQADFGKIHLKGLRVPAPEVPAGGELYVELGWSIDERVDGFRPLLFVAGEGRLVTADLPPAYDWIPTNQWRSNRVYVGRHSLSLPADFPAGSYAIGLALVDASGSLLVAAPPSATPHLAEGEIHWADTVTVVSQARAIALADAQLDEALALADGLRCDAAEQTWASARRHLPRTTPWQADARRRFETALAVCLAREAEPGSPLVLRGIDGADRDAADLIARARRLDHHAPEVVRVSRVLADRWQAEGEEALVKGDAEGAWVGFRDALRADPARSALRRRFEALRAERLEL